MSDPARHRLRTECVQASHIAEGKVQLPHHPLVGGHGTQPLMKLLVGQQDLIEGGGGILFGGNNRGQLFELIVAGRLSQLFCRVSLKHSPGFV